MQLTVNLNEDTVKELIKEEGANIITIFTPEEKRELLSGIIKEFVKNEGYRYLKDVMFDTSGFYNGTRLSDTGRMILKQSISEEDFKDLRDTVIETLKSKSPEILADAYRLIFLNSLGNDYEFKSIMENVAYNTIQRILNENKIY